MPRHSAFLAAFATGALGIVVVRELGPGLGGAVVAASGCAVLIIAFAVISFNRSKVEASRAADDFYYLGLLFTLVSLIHVLVRVFVLGDGGAERTQQLIGNFGIALVSTVVGILVRVVLLGLDNKVGEVESPGDLPADGGRDRGGVAARASPPSPEPAPPEPLRPVASPTDSARDLIDLRDEVRQARDALSHFTRITLAQANQTKSHTERLIDEFNKRVDRMAVDRLRGLDTVESSWTNTAQRIQGQMDSLVAEADDRLAQAVERADAAWHRLARHAEQASDTARRHAEAADQQTAALLESVTATGQSLETLLMGAAGAGQSLSALGSAAGDASTNLGSIVHDIERVTGRTQAAHEAAAEHLSRLRDTLASARETAAPLADLLTTVAHSVGTLREATGQAEAGIRASSEGLGRKLDEATGDLATALDAITSAGKAFEAASASLSSLDESIGRLRQSATAAATGLDARAIEIVAAHDALADGARRSREETLAAYESTVRELSDLARNHREELRREAESWSRAMEALDASIREQQALAEKNAAVAAELLEQLTRKPERGSRFLGIRSGR